MFGWMWHGGHWRDHAETGVEGNSGGTAEGYGTNNDTNVSEEMKGMPQISDLLVELSGIEPLASSLRTRRSPS
jgi:hypothetical protein